MNEQALEMMLAEQKAKRHISLNRNYEQKNIKSNDDDE